MMLTDTITTVSSMLKDAEKAAGTYAGDPQGWHARHRHEMDKLRVLLQSRLGARIDDRWDGASVSLAGIRSSSTSGLAGALRNWIRAAEKRLEKDAAR
ncbi:MAG: hypothetical protein F9K43_27590 [Bauldia sp.]|nr:MAG: hypothetical protein F9K43_27590 [Bauldia sp.]